VESANPKSNKNEVSFFISLKIQRETDID
jgi:hypothetical protein